MTKDSCDFLVEKGATVRQNVEVTQQLLQRSGGNLREFSRSRGHSPEAERDSELGGENPGNNPYLSSRADSSTERRRMKQGSGNTEMTSNSPTTSPSTSLASPTNAGGGSAGSPKAANKATINAEAAAGGTSAAAAASIKPADAGSTSSSLKTSKVDAEPKQADGSSVVKTRTPSTEVVVAGAKAATVGDFGASSASSGGAAVGPPAASEAANYQQQQSSLLQKPKAGGPGMKQAGFGNKLKRSKTSAHGGFAADGAAQDLTSSFAKHVDPKGTCDPGFYAQFLSKTFLEAEDNEETKTTISPLGRMPPAQAATTIGDAYYQEELKKPQITGDQNNGASSLLNSAGSLGGLAALTGGFGKKPSAATGFAAGMMKKERAKLMSFSAFGGAAADDGSNARKKREPLPLGSTYGKFTGKEVKSYLPSGQENDWRKLSSPDGGVPRAALPKHFANGYPELLEAKISSGGPISEDRANTNSRIALRTDNSSSSKLLLRDFDEISGTVHGVQSSYPPQSEELLELQKQPLSKTLIGPPGSALMSTTTTSVLQKTTTSTSGNITTTGSSSKPIARRPQQMNKLTPLNPARQTTGAGWNNYVQGTSRSHLTAPIQPRAWNRTEKIESRTLRRKSDTEKKLEAWVTYGEKLLCLALYLAKEGNPNKTGNCSFFTNQQRSDLKLLLHLYWQPDQLSETAASTLEGSGRVPAQDCEFLQQLLTKHREALMEHRKNHPRALPEGLRNTMVVRKNAMLPMHLEKLLQPMESRTNAEKLALQGTTTATMTGFAGTSTSTGNMLQSSPIANFLSSTTSGAHHGGQHHLQSATLLSSDNGGGAGGPWLDNVSETVTSLTSRSEDELQHIVSMLPLRDVEVCNVLIRDMLALRVDMFPASSPTLRMNRAGTKVNAFHKTIASRSEILDRLPKQEKQTLVNEFLQDYIHKQQEQQRLLINLSRTLIHAPRLSKQIPKLPYLLEPGGHDEGKLKIGAPNERSIRAAVTGGRAARFGVNQKRVLKKVKDCKTSFFGVQSYSDGEQVEESNRNKDLLFRTSSTSPHHDGLDLASPAHSDRRVNLEASLTMPFLNQTSTADLGLAAIQAYQDTQALAGQHLAGRSYHMVPTKVDLKLRYGEDDEAADENTEENANRLKMSAQPTLQLLQPLLPRANVRPEPSKFSKLNRAIVSEPVLEYLRKRLHQKIEQANLERSRRIARSKSSRVTNRNNTDPLYFHFDDHRDLLHPAPYEVENFGDFLHSAFQDSTKQFFHEQTGAPLERPHPSVKQELQDLLEKKQQSVASSFVVAYDAKNFIKAEQTKRLFTGPQPGGLAAMKYEQEEQAKRLALQNEKAGATAGATSRPQKKQQLFSFMQPKKQKLSKEEREAEAEAERVAQLNREQEKSLLHTEQFNWNAIKDTPGLIHSLTFSDTFVSKELQYQGTLEPDTKVLNYRISKILLQIDTAEERLELQRLQGNKGNKSGGVDLNNFSAEVQENENLLRQCKDLLDDLLPRIMSVIYRRDSDDEDVDFLQVAKKEEKQKVTDEVKLVDVALAVWTKPPTFIIARNRMNLRAKWHPESRTVYLETHLKSLKQHRQEVFERYLTQVEDWRNAILVNYEKKMARAWAIENAKPMNPVDDNAKARMKALQRAWPVFIQLALSARYFEEIALPSEKEKEFIQQVTKVENSNEEDQSSLFQILQKNEELKVHDMQTDDIKSLPALKAQRQVEAHPLETKIALQKYFTENTKRKTFWLFFLAKAKLKVELGRRRLRARIMLQFLEKTCRPEQRFFFRAMNFSYHARTVQRSFRFFKFNRGCYIRVLMKRWVKVERKVCGEELLKSDMMQTRVAELDNSLDQAEQASNMGLTMTQWINKTQKTSRRHGPSAPTPSLPKLQDKKNKQPQKYKSAADIKKQWYDRVTANLMSERDINKFIIPELRYRRYIHMCRLEAYKEETRLYMRNYSKWALKKTAYDEAMEAGVPPPELPPEPLPPLRPDMTPTYAELVDMVTRARFSSDNYLVLNFDTDEDPAEVVEARERENQLKETNRYRFSTKVYWRLMMEREDKRQERLFEESLQYTTALALDDDGFESTREKQLGDMYSVAFEVYKTLNPRQLKTASPPPSARLVARMQPKRSGTFKLDRLKQGRSKNVLYSEGKPVKPLNWELVEPELDFNKERLENQDALRFELFKTEVPVLSLEHHDKWWPTEEMMFST
ncbi:unnamed protein product [Amoebophrya sp. A120]|nr:unnamed protein product [Amoebophrya sp. A120]|eukprot:GSA120T00008165001.1